MRFSVMALAVLAAPFMALCSSGDGPPNFTGTWQLDGAKSQSADAAGITLTIQDGGGKFKLTRVVHERDGRDSTSQFACQPGGAQCDFDEGGHKAKVMLWYDGSALVILKTDGPKEDSVTQWRLELSPDGNTLNVDFSHIEPQDKSEKLVFAKKAAAS